MLYQIEIAYARLINSKMLVSDFNRWDVSDKLNNFKENDFSWVANLKYPIIKSEKLLLGFRFSYLLISIHNYYKCESRVEIREHLKVINNWLSIIYDK